VGGVAPSARGTDTGPMLKPLADVAPSPQETFGPIAAVCICLVVVLAAVVVAVVLVRRSRQ
jgi:hypothetical protein